MQVIGLNGLKSSGKSTAAQYLVSEHNFTEISFAYLLKVSVCQLFGITMEQIEEMKNDPAASVRLTFPNGTYKTMTFREFLQRYGTEAHRDVFGFDFWVEQMLAHYDLQPSGRYVAADCRFQNEAIALKRLGGYIVRVDRRAVESDDSHASEAGLPDHMIDVVLDNNSNLIDLGARIDTILESHA
jgi:hypothetical protein